MELGNFRSFWPVKSLWVGRVGFGFGLADITVVIF